MGERKGAGFGMKHEHKALFKGLAHLYHELDRCLCGARLINGKWKGGSQ